MKFLVVIALAASLVGPSKTGPRVVRDRPGHDACGELDPIGPCPGRLLTVYNPLRRHAWFHVNCGPEVMTEVIAPVGAKRRVVLDLHVEDAPGGLKKGQCFIDRWAYRRAVLERWVQDGR